MATAPEVTAAIRSHLLALEELHPQAEECAASYGPPVAANLKNALKAVKHAHEWYERAAKATQDPDVIGEIGSK